MASLAWKLVVTSLGAQNSAFELVVQAENWLDALRAGRKSLQEEGGVPTGASCVMSAAGEVTILDAANRRRYVLTRAQAETRGAARANQVEARGSGREQNSEEQAPRSERPAAPPSSPPSPDGTAADGARPARAKTGSGAPAATEPLPRANQTLAYSAQRAETIRREYESARTYAAPLPAAAAEPAGSGATEARASAREQNGSAREQARVEASGAAREQIVEARGVELEQSGARGALREEVSDARAAAGELIGEASTGLPRPSLRAVPPGSSERPSTIPPPARRSVSDKPELSAPALTNGLVQGRFRSDALIPLLGRDLEPTPQSPLTYRERAYLLASPADRGRLEALLHTELAHVRRDLSGRPRGQFVNLAVFEEPFRGAPTRPPLATLEWKDWRGAPIFSLVVDEALVPPAETADANGSAQGAGEAKRSGRSSAPANDGELRTSQPPPPSLPMADSGVVRASQAPPAPAPQPLPPPAAVLAAISSELPPPSSYPHAPPPPPPEEEDVWPAPEARQSDPSGEIDGRLATAFEDMPDSYFLPTPVAGLEFSIQLLARLMPCEAITTCLYDINTDEFRFVALTGPGALDRQAGAVPSSSGLFGVAKHDRHGDAVLVPDADAEPRYNPQIDGRSGLRARSLAYAAVRHGGQLLGMLQLINREDERGFTNADAAVLTYVAKQLAEFLATRRAAMDE